ncbi:MAG: S9 family peptidase [Bacteroidetes bacterium]|nr:MAG: S9 family peptidase [Bacteroidota bacterium]
MRSYIILLFSFLVTAAFGQNYLTPKALIELNRVGGIGVDNEGNIYYSVRKVDLNSNSSSSKLYKLDVKTGDRIEISKEALPFKDKAISPEGDKMIAIEEVKVRDVFGTDYYPQMEKSNVQIYNELNYRHWDTWEDGKFSHVILEDKKTGERMDIMANEPFDSPQKPFGGEEDFVWAPDGKSLIYVCKKLHGTAYAVSTNTDLFQYFLDTKQTVNLTPNNKGYDTHPVFSSKGTLAYLQMERDGYESDKNDIMIRMNGENLNLTKDWDGTVNEFAWSLDGNKIYFVAPVLGTVQLFEIDLPTVKKGKLIYNQPKQITEGQFDIRGIVGERKGELIVGLGDMNHATELYSISLKTGEPKQLTHENEDYYKGIALSKVEKRMTKTIDNKDLLSWVIYPPDFDPNKKYPTLLYCQGGPQGALSQFYSFRWNFALMAAQGYIVIAPNRRGMPGYGVEWNEQISKDYGGLNMQDYLAAIDDLSKESYVDKERLGCIGASYGGYSVFYLAAIHDGRFKSFIAHDGIFNWKSMYGTTEELFFVNWDLGGAYWDKENATAQKSHNAFNPAEMVEKWNTPIMIIQGGKDFRVPIGQGLEAFQAAQLQGIKSRLLYFPEENHWVLDYQNSFIWHSEFYKWLAETL